MKLSIILTFHNESVYAKATVANIIDLISRLEIQPREIEAILVLDKADDFTTEIVSVASAMFTCKTTLVMSSGGDPAIARMTGIHASNGQMIALCDGDDLYSREWLSRGLQILENSPDTIVHPEYMVVFGNDWTYRMQVLQDDHLFSTGGLLMSNYWGPWIITRRETFDKCPYIPTSPRDITGYTYEDWHWSCETVSAGFKHVLCQETVVFYRRRKNSRIEWDFMQSSQNKIAPSGLFSSLARNSS